MFYQLLSSYLRQPSPQAGPQSAIPPYQQLFAHFFAAFIGKNGERHLTYQSSKASSFFRVVVVIVLTRPYLCFYLADSLVPAVPMSGAELAAALQDDVTLTEAYVKEQRALRKRGRRGGLSVKLKAAEKQRQLLAKLDKLLEMGTYTLVKRKKLKRRAMEEDHDLWECPGDALSGDAQGKTRAKMQLAEAADETAVNELELRETHREIMAVADRLGKKGRLRKSPFGGQVIVRLARLLASRNARVHRQAARALSDLAGRCDVSGSAKRVDGFRKAARDALGFLVDHWELFKDERFGMRLVEVNKLFRLGLPMFRRRVLRRGICSNAS